MQPSLLCTLTTQPVLQGDCTISLGVLKQSHAFVGATWTQGLLLDLPTSTWDVADSICPTLVPSWSILQQLLSL